MTMGEDALSRSFRMFEFFVALGSEPYPVVKLYRVLTDSRDVKMTRQDVYHVLLVLRDAYVISKSRERGGEIVLLPRLFFELSYMYARLPSDDPIEFIKNVIRDRLSIEWCFNGLMNFIGAYGDLIATFFAVVDSIFSGREISFSAITLLLISAECMPKPYSLIIPTTSSLFARLDLARVELSKVYASIKERVSTLTESYVNPVYINARSIATATLFYILLSEGVKRVLYQHDKSDPHLSLLFSLDKKYLHFYEYSVKQLEEKLEERLRKLEEDVEKKLDHGAP